MGNTSSSEAHDSKPGDYAAFLFGCQPQCFEVVDREKSITLFSVCCLSKDHEVSLEFVEQQSVLGGKGAVGSNLDAPPLTIGAGGSVQRSSLLLGANQGKRFTLCYQASDQIGEGSFGDVFMAKVILPGGFPSKASRKLAVKIFSLGSPTEDSAVNDDMNARRHASFTAEVAILASLEHPHIVRMHECFQSTENLHILLELCSGGELYANLVTRIKEAGNGGLPETDAQHFFRQMLWAVSYLHSRRIVHRDIKPENFMLLGEPGSAEAEVLKICDFGTAALLSDEQPRSMVNIGTLSYTAPEVYARKGADLPADVWSLGVVLYVMVTGTNPFRSSKDASKQDTVNKIRAGLFDRQRRTWQLSSTQGKALISGCLVLDERTRLTCSKALNHGWLGTTWRGLPSKETCNEVVTLIWTMLKHVRTLSDAQRLALTACSLSVTEADVPRSALWRSLFLIFDKDLDGRLSLSEVCQGLRLHLTQTLSRVPEDELIALVEELDFDKNGFIDWGEWLILALLSRIGFSKAPFVPLAYRLLDRSAQSPSQAVRQTVGHVIADLACKDTIPSSDQKGISLEDFCAILSSCEA